ncbi:MAG: hypothetical protein J6Z17_04460 [Treponema sp.]|nr:hypothetical protein [Treponema sp.]
MEIGHLFETAMLVCFGFSWPLNVRKAYRARTTKGTSLAFIFLIITGYVAGILAKFINHQINYVLAVYFLNLAIVMLNVFVYIRNKSLDKKAAAAFMQKNTNEKETNMNYTYSLDEIINPKTESAHEEKNAVILFGSGTDKKIPVQSLGKEFKFNFKIYNKSADDLSIAKAIEYFSGNIAPLAPEGILIHLGTKDIANYKNNCEQFVSQYLDLISEIKKSCKKCRIALVSLSNSSNSKTVSDMNRHIRAIAESEKCTFVNLDNAKLWNPEATKAAVNFAYSMGLNTRKPLGDVAEILYSYAYNVLAEETPATNVAV